MSRTVRNLPDEVEECLYRELVRVGWCHYQWLRKTPTKTDIALAKRDGKQKYYPSKYYMNQISRVRRHNDKQQFAKLKKCVDYDDFHFDDSTHQAKRKGVWWEIY